VLDTVVSTTAVVRFTWFLEVVTFRGY